MKLVRYGAPGREKPGMIDAEGRVRDLSKIVPDIGGDALSPTSLNKLRKLKPEKLPLVRGKQRIGACVGKIGNFIAIGLNYSDHAAEAGMPIPKEPVIFNKARTCICGPNDDTIMPKDSSKLDWEVELGVVIGKTARFVSKELALDVVAGFTIINDVSARDWQWRSPTFTLGKSFDTTGPLGPWLVTTDEIPDPSKLTLMTRLNGAEMQRSGTDMLIYSIPRIISYVSGFTPLEPGDVIATGTPAGVGFARNPPVWMKAGDVLEVEISGIGTLRSRIVDEK